jgi:hypothetical protein
LISTQSIAAKTNTTPLPQEKRGIHAAPRFVAKLETRVIGEIPDSFSGECVE